MCDSQSVSGNEPAVTDRGGKHDWGQKNQLAPKKTGASKGRAKTKARLKNSRDVDHRRKLLPAAEFHHPGKRLDGPAKGSRWARERAGIASTIAEPDHSDGA